MVKSSTRTRTNGTSKTSFPQKNRLGLVSNGLNNDFLIGTYHEIGISHEGHLVGFVSSTLHVTFLTNTVVKGIVLRPELRFYLKENPTIKEQGLYIAMGGTFSYLIGKDLPGALIHGTANLYRLGLTGGLGYQYTFDSNIFLNLGILSGISTGYYQSSESNLPNELWYSENRSHPLFSTLTLLARVGYAF